MCVWVWIYWCQPGVEISSEWMPPPSLFDVNVVSKQKMELRVFFFFFFCLRLEIAFFFLQCEISPLFKKEKREKERKKKKNHVAFFFSHTCRIQSKKKKKKIRWDDGGWDQGLKGDKRNRVRASERGLEWRTRDGCCQRGWKRRKVDEIKKKKKKRIVVLDLYIINIHWKKKDFNLREYEFAYLFIFISIINNTNLILKYFSHTLPS